MADVLTGALMFDKGKWKIVFHDEARNKDITLFVSEVVFATEFNPKEGEEIEVDFERDTTPQRNATKVRVKGKEWVDKQLVQTLPNRGAQQQAGDFHNPYNFIPAPPRPRTGSDLDDALPISHDCYQLGRWSGRLSVRLKTKTPLLIVDTARTSIDDKDHKTFHVRLDLESKPYIAPPSIKGMLRAAYEAVTNSRMGMFVKHGDRLAYRMPAKLGPVPARVEKRNDVYGLRIMRAEEVVQIGYGAKLPRYEDERRTDVNKGAFKSGVALRFNTSGELPQHGDSVWVQIDRSRCTRIEPRTNGNRPAGDWYRGWVCVTGPNINRKKYERVFIEGEGKKDDFIEITDRHKRLWRELIVNYQETHWRDLQLRKRKGWGVQDYRGDKPGQTGWSRHIDPDLKDYIEVNKREGDGKSSRKQEFEIKDLHEGTLCYVEFEPGSKSEITAVVPVTISRRLYEVSPEILLPDSLKPARRVEELSPADRVFGWVNQNGNGAYKGNLRIGMVKCVTENAIEPFSNTGVPLAILGQPKPQQARFYVASSIQSEAQKNGISREQAGYWPNKGLRGRKVYPQHSKLPEGYWENPEEDRTQQNLNGHFQEYRRPHRPIMDRGFAQLDETRTAFKLDSDHEQRDDQNRSVTGWVKPNTTFEFEIGVTNLSRVELGGLLWLLELPDDHYHRLGGGKPLGFGSVTVSIDWNKTDLQEGKSLKQRYEGLEAIVNDNPMAAQDCIDNFRREVARSYGSNEFERASFIAAFRRYARGFNKPVHYPRTSQPGQRRNSTIPPHPEGKSFEWFVANERTGKFGGPKLSLPDLVSDEGLPILESR
jgi:CRISPR-associated protein (TIGR03986 family)